MSLLLCSLSCGEGVPVGMMDRRGVGWGEHSRRGKAGCRPERGEEGVAASRSGIETADIGPPPHLPPSYPLSPRVRLCLGFLISRC